MKLKEIQSRIANCPIPNLLLNRRDREPSVLHDLPLDAIRRIEVVCTQFEADFRSQVDSSQTLFVEQYLAGFEGVERDALRSELVELEAELRSESCVLASAALGERDVANPKVNLSTRYRFESPVGQGGIGKVWRVYDLDSQRNLAIKVLRSDFRRQPQAVARLLREALLTGILQHPGIPPVYDHGYLDSGLAFFAMKLVEGETFDGILKGRTSAEERFAECIDVFEQVAQTLAYAHSRGVIHRDLKPQNIMVGRFAEVQVMDWGMAKQLRDPVAESPLVSMPFPNVMLQPTENSISEDQENTLDYGDRETPVANDLTRVGDVVGTPSYMAPEQARGDIDTIDSRTDVFGLGTILYEILTLERPLDGGSSADVLARCARADFSEAFARLAKLVDHPELVSLCRKCLSPAAEDRPQDASEVAQSVSDYTASLRKRLQQAEIARAEALVASRETGRRQRLIALMSTITAAVAIAGAVAVSWQWNKAATLALLESRARAQAESEAVAVGEINGFLDKLLASAQPDEFGSEVTVGEVLYATLEELEGKFSGKPFVEGSIRKTLGRTFRGLGDKYEAETQLRAALALLLTVEPPVELDVLDTMDALAGVLRSRDEEGDMEEATELRESVLARRIELLGENHAEVLVDMNNLALVYQENGELTKAENLYERLVEKEELRGSIYDSQIVRGNLAALRLDQGNFDAAERELRKLVVELEDAPRSRLNGNVFVTLSELLSETDRLDEAIPYLEMAVAAREDYFGRAHPDTLSAIRKLSRSLVTAGQYQIGLTQLVDCLALHDEVYGADSGFTFGVREWIPKALVGLNRINEAEDFLLETYHVLSAGRGSNHAYTLEALTQLRDFREDHQLEQPPMPR